MMDIKALFKNTRPVIREFKLPEGDDAGDMPELWNAYKQGLLEDLPDSFDMKDFLEIVEVVYQESFEMYTVEDFVKGALVPVGLIVVKSIDVENWQIEPHLVYYDVATPRVKIRVYAAFLRKTKYRKDIGSCVIRTPKEGTKLANKAEQLGLVEYVGKIWGGRPGGNDYIYSLRCNRRQ